MEPVYTFRAHTGPVLSLAVSPDGDYCFSGGIDSSVRIWNMPRPDIDPYDNFCKNELSFFFFIKNKQSNIQCPRLSLLTGL